MLRELICMKYKSMNFGIYCCVCEQLLVNSKFFYGEFAQEKNPIKFSVGLFNMYTYFEKSFHNT